MEWKREGSMGSGLLVIARQTNKNNGRTGDDRWQTPAGSVEALVTEHQGSELWFWRLRIFRNLHNQHHPSAGGAGKRKGMTGSYKSHSTGARGEQERLDGQSQEEDHDHSNWDTRLHSMLRALGGVVTWWRQFGLLLWIPMGRILAEGSNLGYARDIFHLVSVNICYPSLSSPLFHHYQINQPKMTFFNLLFPYLKLHLSKHQYE